MGARTIPRKYPQLYPQLYPQPCFENETYIILTPPKSFFSSSQSLIQLAPFNSWSKALKHSPPMTDLSCAWTRGVSQPLPLATNPHNAP